MRNSHREFPHQAIEHWQHLHPAAWAAGPSHPSAFLVVFPSGSVSEGLIPQPLLTPSCPVCLPVPPARGGAGSRLCYWARGERWDSPGELCRELPAVPEHGASPDNGRKPRPARLPARSGPGKVLGQGRIVRGR